MTTQPSIKADTGRRDVSLHGVSGHAGIWDEVFPAMRMLRTIALLVQKPVEFVFHLGNEIHGILQADVHTA